MMESHGASVAAFRAGARTVYQRTDIYLVRGILYEMLDREGFRIEEALTLDFVDLDLTTG